MATTGRIEDFIHLMNRFHKLEGKASFHGRGQDESLTLLQLGALSYLIKHPRSSVGALGSHLGLSSSAVAQLTDRLASSKLIARENNPRDRRAVLLTVTKQGAEICSKLYKAHVQKMKKVLAFMPETDLKELIRIFSTLLKKLQAERLHVH